MIHRNRTRAFLGALAALLLAGSFPAPAAAQTAEAPLGPVVRGYPIVCSPSKFDYVIDEFFDTCRGVSTLSGPGWARRAENDAYQGAYRYITAATQNLTETATWTPNLGVAGMYDVWVGYRSTSNRSMRAPFYVHNDADPEADYLFHVNQYAAPLTGGIRSVRLGRFPFAAGRGGKVVARNGSGHSESIDAVAFHYAGPEKPAGLVATGGAGRIDLEWNAALGATSYRILRNTVDSRTGAVQVGVVTGATSFANTTTDVEFPIEVNTPYWYFVRAVGAINKTAVSTSATATATAP